MQTKKLRILLILLVGAVIICVVSVALAFMWYNSNLKPVSDAENKSIIEVNIEEGIGVTGVADVLAENKIIKNADVMKIYVRINKIPNLQAGKYKLDNSEDMATIIEHIANGEIATDEVKITFIEGKNMKWIAKKIAENTINTEEDVFSLLENEEYIDSLVEKYWFITEEIKDSRIYYPLEGYLLPDTYIFENEEVSIKTIFNILLNYMDKLLIKYKDDIDNSNLTVHQMLTIASLAEMEGKSTEDRAEIVGVFFNRLASKMSLGSDVTTYYAAKVDMSERELYKSELNQNNPYNTRGPNMEGKIPVGPICNPSESAIKATLNYKETDAIYFIADKNGKVYFTKTYDEHNKTRQKLIDDGLWHIYE